MPPLNSPLINFLPVFRSLRIGFLTPFLLVGGEISKVSACLELMVKGSIDGGKFSLFSVLSKVLALATGKLTKFAVPNLGLVEFGALGLEL